MASKEISKAIQDYENYISRKGIDSDVMSAYYQAVFWAKEKDNDIETALKISPRAKEVMNQYVINLYEKQGRKGDIWTLEKECFECGSSHEILDDYYKILKTESPYLFESYLLYLEKNRDRSERFYSPKMKQLNKHGLIQAMQDLEDDKLERLCISMPPGTQKTTLEKFFCSWIIGKYPKDYSLFFSHSGDITAKFYKGILDITTDSNEYTWGEIFPDVKFHSTNAKLEEINFDKYKSYANIQCSSIGAKNAGKVRTNRYLYCDDLIGGIEEALNPNILNKIWRIYGVDLKQRKLNEQVKEIIIMTRWSTQDIIGRIKELYAGNPKIRFIAVPDIDPKTGQSNFDYEFNGMSVSFFNDQALTMDEVSYKCLYKQEPIEREGLLFPEDKVMRFTKEDLQKLREKPPEIVTGQCDTKGKGTDFFVLPCFEKYGNYYYCTDCVCDNSPDYELQYENSANLIVDNEMQDCVFESNNGGDRVSEEVAKRVEEKGWICNIRPEATETNKEARIFQCSNWILQHIKFMDKSMYAPKSQYGIMMAQLLSYSVSGKNPNDDVADVFATFALRVKQGNKRRKTRIMPSPA